MIRANLLPRRRESVSMLGTDIDLDLMREIATCMAIILVIALIGYEIEALRTQRLTTAAINREAEVAQQGPLREESRHYMLDIARYQEFERETAIYRRSGADAAIAIAQVGNSIPNGVWIDTVERADGGYTISGGSRSVDGLAAAIASLGRAMPAARASLVNISNRDRGASVQFTARVVPIVFASAAPTPTAAR